MAAPTGFAARVASGTRVSLAWTDAADNETGYIVERSEDSGSTYTAIDWVEADATTYDDWTAAQGTEYYYRVKAGGVGGDNYGSVYATAGPVNTNSAFSAGIQADGANLNTESATYTIHLSGTGVSATHLSRWVIDWGDGWVDQVTPSSVDGSADASHVYLDDGEYTVAARAFDDEGGVFMANWLDANSLPVLQNNQPVPHVPATIADVAPTVSIAGASYSSVGASYTLLLHSDDPGILDEVTSWTVKWGDAPQNDPDADEEPITGNPSSATHQYAANGAYTIHAWANNSDGAQPAESTVNVEVVHAFPTPPLACPFPYTYYSSANQTLTVAYDGPAGMTYAIPTGGGPAHGTVSMQSNGDFTYTPDADYTGVDRFLFQGTRDGQLTNVATAVIQVGVSYTLPRLAWDIDFYSYDAQMDTELSVGTTTGLTSILDSGSSGFAVVLPMADWMLPKHGTLSVNSDGSFTYTPNTGYVGVDCFSFEATNEQNGIPGNALPVLINVSAPSWGSYQGVHSQLAGYNSVDLSWGDLTGGITSYQIQYATSLPLPYYADPQYTVTVPAGTSHYLFSDLDENTTYYFRVRANDGSPYQNWSPMQTLTTGSLATVSVVADDPTPAAGQPAVFTFTRSGDASKPLAVYFTLTGAVPGILEADGDVVSLVSGESPGYFGMHALQGHAGVYQVIFAADEQTTSVEADVGPGLGDETRPIYLDQTAAPSGPPTSRPSTTQGSAEADLRGSVPMVTLRLNPATQMTPQTQNSSHDESFKAAGTEALGELPMGTGRTEAKQRGLTYVCSTEVIGTVEEPADLSKIKLRWRRWVEMKAWTVERSGEKWVVKQRMDSALDQSDSENDEPYNTTVPNNRRIYSCDTSGLLMPLYAAAGVGGFVYAEKRFRYSVEYEDGGKWFEAKRFFLNQVIAAERVATTGTIATQWTARGNTVKAYDTRAEAPEPSVTKEKIRELVHGELPIEFDDK